MGRILLAALIGGILEFGWGAFAHNVLTECFCVSSTLPNEDEVLAAVKAVPPGMYDFPHYDAADRTEESDARWLERAKAGGSGILIRWPNDAPALGATPRQLILEFASNVLCALLLACAAAGRAFGVRVLLGPLFGLFAFLSQNASQWIWYHYSDAVTHAELLDAVCGWTIAGFGIACILRRKAA